MFCMNVYVYVLMYMYIYMQVKTGNCRYMSVKARACVHMYVCKCVHAVIQRRMRMYMRVHACMYA